MADIDLEDEVACGTCNGTGRVTRHDFHRALVDGSTDPAAICEICGARADRAIHDPRTAARYGKRF